MSTIMQDDIISCNHPYIMALPQTHPSDETHGNCNMKMEKKEMCASQYPLSHQTSVYHLPAFSLSFIPMAIELAAKIIRKRK